MTAAIRLSCLLFWFIALSGAASAQVEPKKPNVLFIAIDDLNHWVGFLGRHPQARTPNLDRLASAGVSFSNAYCTAPACKPSRASLMSGMRPSTTGCYHNNQDWHRGIPGDKLLNTHFLRNDYRVYGAGKIYHGSNDRGGEWTDYFDDPALPGKLTPHPSVKERGVGSLVFHPLANSNEEMPDHRTVDWCIDRLREEADGPFFIACGLVKPHLPFCVPMEWFEKFPLESIELPPWREDDLDDVPPAGVRMAKPDGDHAAILASGRWREAVQAYLATVAYCDYEVGRLLDALEASPHRDQTVVCLWSDHGWSLGEKSHWRKFALWEEPSRTVLVWKAPGLTPVGAVSHWPVDHLNLFPTLCSLAGLPRPDHLEGFDMSPLLEDPAADWDQPAITTEGRGNHAIRFGDWRYIRYADGGEELYDRAGDPLEHTNLASRPENAGLKAELAGHLPKQEAPDLPAERGRKEAKARKRDEGEKKAKGKGREKGAK